MVKIIAICLCFLVGRALATWLTQEAAELITRQFLLDETARSKIQFRGTDLRTSTPFVSGDGFRHHCAHVCDETNRCRMHPETVQNGSCIFVKADFYQFFVESVIPRIPGTYKIVSHNGDLSCPDGQTDAGRIQMSKYLTSNLLEHEYQRGRLLAHHGQNLWWRNVTQGAPRPPWAHCLPIGIENRQYAVGKHPQAYASALQENIINKKVMSTEEMSNRQLLLVAFYPKSRVPDRLKVLVALGAYAKDGKMPKVTNPWYNLTDLSHKEWLDAIPLHRFVLAPFGHGLDTHRVTEILLMGGVPVMRRSTISSCYDDSDNIWKAGNSTKTRGSLPVVILDSWADLTKERLVKEWTRIVQVPRAKWDWSRLVISHWISRIDGTANPGHNETIKG